MSKEKAQIFQPSVNIWVLNSHKDGDQIPDRRETLVRGRVFTTKIKLWGVLEMAGFCPIWITIFGLIAKPLSEALKGGDSEPLE